MDTAARIDILRRSGFSPQTTAAILGVDYAEVQQFASDPSDVPDAPGGSALTPVTFDGGIVGPEVDGSLAPTDGNEQQPFTESPFGTPWVYQGFEPESGDLDISIPGGIYLTSFQVSFNHDDDTSRGMELRWTNQVDLDITMGSIFFGDGADAPLDTSFLEKSSWVKLPDGGVLNIYMGHDASTPQSPEATVRLARVAA